MAFSETSEEGHGGGQKGWISFDSKTKKGIKAMGNLFKQVGKIANPAVDAVSAFGELAEKMGVMDAIMQGLSPIFDIMSSLMSVLSGSITQALMPAIQPLIDMMPSIIPLIQQIGEFIGRTIAIGLEPLLTLLDMFLPILEPMLPVILQLLELGLIPLQVIFEVIFAVLEPFLPYLQDMADAFEQLSPVIEQLTPIITNLIKWSLLPLVEAIFGIGLVVAGFIDAFTLGAAGAMKGWRNLMEPIINSLLGVEETKPGSYEGVWDVGVPGMQTGTAMVIKSGMMHVEAGEAIKRAELPGVQESLLEELVILNKQQMVEKRRSDFFNRSRRR